MVLTGSLCLFGFNLTGFVFTKRWNKNLGISDYAMVLFSKGSASLVGELVLMPILSLSCIVSPKNIEATTYSVFTSTLNAGVIISNFDGVFVTNAFGVTAHNFYILFNWIDSISYAISY
jgi:hypothetical protein